MRRAKNDRSLTPSLPGMFPAARHGWPARRTDPAPSQEAARAIQSNLTDLQAHVLAAIGVHGPGLTATELARAEGLPDPRTFNRRLGELEAAGRVVRGRERRCGITGRTAATWSLPATGAP